MQNLEDIAPPLLEIKAIPIKFPVKIDLGARKEALPHDVVRQINELLGRMNDGFRLE